MPNPNPDTSGLAPPWKPGQSGNPSGMPKENITFFINKYLEMPIKEMLEIYHDKERREALPAKEAIALIQVGRAIEGKEYPTDRVLDRTEGKATETVVILGAEKIEDIDRNIAALVNAKANYEQSDQGTSPAVEQ